MRRHVGHRRRSPEGATSVLQPSALLARPASSGHASEEWLVASSRGVDSFAAIAGEWDDLHSRCSSATPFQSAAWLVGWCRWYAPPPGEVRLVLVRRSGTLVAAAALVVRRRVGIRVLSVAGHDLSDVTDVLVDDQHPGAVGHLAAAVRAEPGWDVLDLPELRAGAAAAQLQDGWPGRSWTTAGSVCLELPGKAAEEILPGLPGRTRRTLLKKLKVVDRSGVAVRSVPVEEVPGAVGTLLDLHQRQWAGRGGNPEHIAPRFRGWLAESLPQLCSTGAARIEEYSVGGVVLASQVLVVGRDFVGAYLGGTAPELRERMDTAALHIRHDLRVTADLGIPTLSLLRGDEDYKKRWRPTAVAHRRVLLARQPARAALYAGAVLGRGRLRAVLAERYPDVRAALAGGLSVRRSAGTLAGAVAVARLLSRRKHATPLR